MKKFLFIFSVALVATAGRAALPQPDLIAQIHFAGGEKISAEKGYAAFTNEFASAETLALRRQTADKLAPWLAGWLQTKLGATVPDGAAKLRPLLDDLQTAEWFLEARAAADGRPDTAIAIRLDPARAQLWQTALKPFFPAATFKQPAGWLIFNAGLGTGKLDESLAQKISAPPPGWLKVDVNWPRLAHWYPALKDLALPETLFDVTAPDTNLHIDGKFIFPENLSLKLDPWQVPYNTIHPPLASFTATRGIAGWLNGQSWAQPVRLAPTVNQLVIWSMIGPPFQSFAAAPVADPNTALHQLDAGLQQVMAERAARDGLSVPMTLEMTNNEILLRGAPVFAPYVKAIAEPGGKFLLAGGFPNTVRGKPLPPELFRALAVPNLVYYHWENTAERLPSQLNLAQLTMVLTCHREIDGSTAAYKWITETAKKLGNTDTEITQTAPDQLTFTRKAPGGLTAFELLALASWLEAPDFPGCNLNLPPIPEKLKQYRLKHPRPVMISAPGH